MARTCWLVVFSLVLLGSAESARADLDIFQADFGVADVDEFGDAAVGSSDNRVMIGFVDATGPKSIALNAFGIDASDTGNNLIYSSSSVIASLSSVGGSGVRFLDFTQGSPTGGISGTGMDALLDDVAVVKGGDLVLSLGTLAAGKYRIRTFHHAAEPNALFGPNVNTDVVDLSNPFDVYLNTQGNEYFRGTIDPTHGYSPATPAMFETGNFFADGIHEVSLRFDGGAGINPSLNGVIVTAVPEPSHVAVMSLAALAIGGVLLRKRRLQRAAASVN